MAKLLKLRRLLAATTLSTLTENTIGGDVTIPVVDVTVPFPGGRVETAFWGNCSGGNEKIKVNAASGDYEVCVNPGDSQLGTTREGKKISGASKIGAC